ncbi:hypothetical protein [Streptomyces regalis]|uniref:DUF4352 domain-containing protein n=1 Tax=Streptomyces regalis TaxID=68262 RepID=A0A0X3VAD7_9ACTN|nr:hypothetical protein [Streptomyces regalis]KUL41710.1 hypothetical protein ADL12_11105 [Streptomyces regalis]
MPQPTQRAGTLEPPEVGPENSRKQTALAALAGLLLGAGIATATATALWPHQPAPTLRPLEAAPGTDSVRSGNLQFDATGLRCGITTVIGTHGEHWAKGRLCRIRLTITSQDSVFGQIDNDLHRLVLDNGSELPLDREATQIKRQPLRTEVAAHGAITYDLWYDLPHSRHPTALRVRANDTEPPATIPLPRRDWTEGSA